MSTPGKVALGIFLTLLTLCLLGVFDPQFNAFFEAQALDHENWLTRTLYPIFRPSNLIAETRGGNPIGYTVIAAIPSFGISMLAYVFLMGLRAIDKAIEVESPEVAEDAETPSAS